MAEKATFDGPQKIITINFGETDIIAQKDLYSAWKRWTLDVDNAKYLQAFRTVGGDVIGVGQTVSPYFFLLNGWRVRSWEGDHFLTVDGNLFVDEGGSPFIPLIGDYQVVISLVVSPQSITNTVTVTAGVLSDQDKDDITSGVWSEPSSAGGTDSMGELQRDIKTDTSLIPGTV
ncbi:unnamed protein product [marine sediment metagenome]|uniref:Uncharacterized protein n=1 Tax=marine sediment metagenome TaxID=412755 RepID=X0WE92_9ZZZZ